MGNLFIYLSAGLGLLFGITSGLLVYFFNNKQSFTSLLQNKIRVSQILSRFIEETPANRVCIYSTSNGGGKPKVGSALHISAIYEKVSHPLKSILNLHQFILLDDNYITILAGLTPKTYQITTMDSFVGDSVLRGIHESENLPVSIFFYLHESSSHFYYIHITCDKINELALIDAKYFWVYQSLTEQLKEIFNLYY